jgi:phospholipid/cholesterol/gamma-HCH transport system substrate-binding protein
MRLGGWLSFAAFLGIVAAFLGYIAPFDLRVTPPKSRTSLSMDLPYINNIEVDSNVLLRGVQIGKVTSIDTSLATATVHFYIDGQYRIPLDSDVRLENLSALGEAYIELEPRQSGGPVLKDGQRIATELVARPPSISELGVSVVRVLNQLNPDQLKRVVGEADTGLPDPNSVLPNLARASTLVRNTAADMHGRGQDVLGNLQTLLRNAGWLGPALAETTPSIHHLGDSLHQLWFAGTNLPLRNWPESYQRFGYFLDHFQKLLDDRGADIRTLGVALSGNIKAIADSLATIDSAQVLTHLLEAVPEDGAIDLHVTIPAGGPGR